MKFSDWSRNNTRATVGPGSAFDAPSFQLTLRIYAAMNGLGGGAKMDFLPERGKPCVRHWQRMVTASSHWMAIQGQHTLCST